MYSRWSLSLAVFMMVCGLWGCESKDYCAYSSCDFEEMSAPDADMRGDVECVRGDECPSLTNAQASCSAAGECVYTCDERWAVGPGGDLKSEGCTCDKTMSSCQSDAVCGDGFKEGEEQCDQGVNNSDTQPDACRSSCEQAACGDKVVDAGEACDDGDDDNSDDCTQGCSRCGNGKIDEGETCDDGQYPPVSGDGCSATCQTEPYWYCEPGKECELHLHFDSAMMNVGGLDFSASKHGLFIGGHSSGDEFLGVFKDSMGRFSYSNVVSKPGGYYGYGFAMSAHGDYVAVAAPLTPSLEQNGVYGSVFLYEKKGDVWSEVFEKGLVTNFLYQKDLDGTSWAHDVQVDNGFVFVTGLTGLASVIGYYEERWRFLSQGFSSVGYVYKGISGSFFSVLNSVITVGRIEFEDFTTKERRQKVFGGSNCQGMDGLGRLNCSVFPEFSFVPGFNPALDEDNGATLDFGGDVWGDSKYVYITSYKRCESQGVWGLNSNGCVYVYDRFDGQLVARLDNISTGSSFARMNSFGYAWVSRDDKLRFDQIVSFGDYLAVADTEASVNGLPKVGRVVVFKNTGDWKSYEHRVIEPMFVQANMNFGYNLAVHDGVLWIGASDARLTYVDPVNPPRGFITKADLAKLFEEPAR